MKFDINNYKGKYVMHCRTKGEAINFIESTGFMETCFVDYWEIYKEDTCYSFNDGTYCKEIFYKSNGYTILEWSDFMYKGEIKMNKSNNTLLPKDVDNVIFNGNNTVVTLTDGRKGISKCEESDEFDPYMGFAIAYYKAKHDKNFELKRMFNGCIEYSKKKGYKQTIIKNK